MKFYEILPEIINGNFAELDEFGERYLANCDGRLCWFTKSDNKFLETFNGHISCLSDNWKIYKKPKKYINAREVMQALLDGKTLSKDYFEELYKIDEKGQLTVDGIICNTICFSDYNRFYIVDDKCI